MTTEKVDETEFAETVQELFDTVGNRLRGIRLRQDMTQRDAQSSTDISDVYISGLERGQRNPTLERLCRLALAYGYKVAVLIETEEDIILLTEKVTELREQERDAEKYVDTLRNIGEQIKTILETDDESRPK